ncbi:MAG: serine hydrolase domain-containing protein [Erythrobacter sp.]|nr:serine hydrolase domain-containing protein [Erythrobacter sp.]
MISRTIATVSLGMALCIQGTSALAQSPSERLDAVFSGFDNTRTAGCAVGITRNGEFLFERSYGMANLEHGVPIDSESVFRIASVSKQFTATAIAILAERGDLDLDADVRTYLPDLTEYVRPVTVRQMIHHISGMGDYGGFEVRPGETFRFGDQDYWTTEQFYAAVATKPLEHEAGAGFKYSNLAYFLLGQVVERVSGKTLREFADAEIFAPAGMSDTLFYDDVREIVPRRALGHTAHEDGSLTIGMTNLDWVGDGGVHTTLADMAKWDRVLASGDFPGGKAFIAKLHTPYVADADLPGGEGAAETGYAFGMNVSRTDEGETLLQHSGGWVGFNAHYARFVERDYGVIALCNRNDGLAFGRYEGLMAAASAFVDAIDEAGE